MYKLATFARYTEIKNNPEQWPVDFELLRDWLEDFICQPNAQLKRNNAVCPHAKPAIEQSKLLLTHIDLANIQGNDKRQVLADDLLNIAREFRSSTSSEEFSLDCLIVTLNGVAKHEWRYVMNGSYSDVKPEVLKLKLMVGAFHPVSIRRSRENPEFFPLRSPIPLFAFRHMIRLDWHSLQESSLYLSIYKSFYPDFSKQ